MPRPKVDLDSNTAIVFGDVSDDAIRDAIHSIGYTVVSIEAPCRASEIPNQV